MSTNPTLILVPGGWHTAAVWDKVSKLLEAQGYNCIGVNLPTCAPNPSATFADDIQAVRKVILSETHDKNRNVVLVVWSYGGQVGNSAIKGLTSKTSNTIGQENNNNNNNNNSSHGHVLGIALIASGFTATGTGFLEATNGIPPPFITLNTSAGYAELSANAVDLFYHDLSSPEEAQYWSSQLTPLSLKCLAEGGEHAYAGWKDVPTWFLVPLEDRALPSVVQKGFVQMAREQGGDVTVREVRAGHAVMLSRPGECADFVREAVEAFVIGS